MFQRLRSRLHGEEGFTLIELLVVILIIGILAAIAIPSFLNQKGKANDADAKSEARSAQTAMETYATDHNGSYTADQAALHAIEPTIPATGGGLTVDTPTATENYSLTVTSGGGGGRTFTIAGNKNGTTSRTCTIANAGDNAGGCTLTGDISTSTSGTW